MENTTEQSSKDNLQLFDLEDFDFKPINKGLGFHHGESNKIPTINKVVTTSSSSPANSLSTRQKIVTKNKTQSSSSAVNMSPELSAFYGQQKPEINNSIANEAENLVKEESVTETYKGATTGVSLVAYLIDLTIIGSILSALAYSLILTLGISVTAFYNELSMNEIGLFVAFFSFIYLSYFSILELASTPGKAMMKIKVVSNSGSFNFKQSSLRSFISLFSLLLVGLPALLDFSSKLSDTRVVYES